MASASRGKRSLDPWRTIATRAAAADLSIEELSRRSGVNRATLFRWINGESIPKIPNLQVVENVISKAERAKARKK